MTSGDNFVVKAFHGDLFSGYLQSTRLRFQERAYTPSQRSFVDRTGGLTRRRSRDNHPALRQEAVFQKNTELQGAKGWCTDRCSGVVVPDMLAGALKLHGQGVCCYY